MKKLAVVGAGNAGCITALHFKKYLPDLEIDLYHDSANHPIERVGQGATLPVANLIADSFNFNWFKNDIGATIKTGILYKDWGLKKDKIFHPFEVMYQVSMHYTPKKLSNCVLSSGKFNVKEQEIKDPEKEIDADFIIDCRGRNARERNNLDTLVNPINHVLLASLPRQELNWTEAVATPNGWTFIVPTEDKLSLGYLYNAGLTSKEEATKDFQERFKVEEIEYSMHFDNYCTFNPFVGERTLLNGNQCAFIEPLEATATGLYLWIAKVGYDFLINKMEISQCIQLIHQEVHAIEQFVLWHYKTGSKFNSPFWDHVKTLPFTPIQITVDQYYKENKHFGQWGKQSLDIWKDNT